MELFAGCRSASEKKQLHGYLQTLRFTTLPLTPDISGRAGLLIETHVPGFDLSMADALIAATALEHGMTMATGNYRHFKVIKGLDIQRFSIAGA